MNFSEISPYIRFAMRFTHMPGHDYFTAQDARLFYICGGKGRLTVSDRIYSFSNGDLLLFPAGLLYQFDSDAEIDMISINFDYTPAHADINFPLPPINMGPTRPRTLPCPAAFPKPPLDAPLLVRTDNSIRECLRRILLEAQLKQPLHTELCSVLLKEILLKAVRSTMQPPQNTGISQKLEIVLDYIQNHYKQNISNAMLGELVNYHPYYLNRLWIKTRHCSLHQYLIQYRISVSEQLLLTTGLSIADIAEAVGFTNTVSFNQHFKKKNHMTPSEFRKQRGQGAPR